MEKQDKEKALSALEKIKLFLSGKREDIKMKLEFALADGTLAEATAEGKELSELEPGAEVTVKTPEGNIPIADGEHQSDSGSIFQTEGGVVKEVATAEQIEEAAKAAESEKGDAATVAEMRKELDELKKMLADKSESDEKLKTEMAEVKKERDEANEQLTESKEIIKLAKETIEAVSNLPVDTPSKKTETATRELTPKERAIQMGENLFKMENKEN